MVKMDYPTNTDDVIDSRDIEAAIEELESEIADLQEMIDDADTYGEPTDDIPDAETRATTVDRLADLRETLAPLKALADEASQYAADWQYGEVLIRESYFAEYVEGMLKDCGELPRDLPSYVEIDWQETADNVRVDYTEVYFDGVPYLIR